MSDVMDKLAEAYLLIKLCVALGAIGAVAIVLLLVLNAARPFIQVARFVLLGPALPPGYPAPPPGDVAAGAMLGFRILAWGSVVAAGLFLWSCGSEGKAGWDRVQDTAGSYPPK
jgi:hypothetical protein